jgi:heat shock protein HslJ
MKVLLIILAGCLAMASIPQSATNKKNNPKSTLSNSPLQNIHWKLVELGGKEIPGNATAKEMFIVFKNDSTVSGNGGCNTFSGMYSLGKNNEISFGEMVRTNMLCSGVDFERKYINALSKTDHYKITGDTLSLRNQLVIIAKFIGKK